MLRMTRWVLGEFCKRLYWSTKRGTLSESASGW
jgi:hypothetical protein